MDMVGGGPATKAVFHVTRGPMSLPSFVHDVAWAFAEFVNEESYKFAATGSAEYPFVAPEGGKEPLRAEYSAYTMGSDHDVYQDSSFGIPAIYMNDWPDRYIHTNFDTAANIDTTKLKRAAFIGAASGYFLAGIAERTRSLCGCRVNDRAIQTTAGASFVEQLRRIDAEGNFASMTEQGNSWMRSLYYDVAGTVIQRPNRHTIGLSSNFASHPLEAYEPITARLYDQSFVQAHGREPKGPLAVFGYDYFADHAKTAGVATPKLFGYEGLWGGGEEYAYEVLNFADGKRNAQEIRDAVSAEYGPVPVEMVVEYLRALEKIGVVAEVK